MILDGERLGEQLFGERVDPRALLVRMHPELAGVVPPLGHVVLTADPLPARINHGIWIFSCPCGARGLPTPGGVVFTDTPLGWCARCQNGGTGRGWRRITVPLAADRASIEVVLLLRARIEDRNWCPGETVTDLVAENLEHGEPIPDLGTAGLEGIDDGLRHAG